MGIVDCSNLNMQNNKDFYYYYWHAMLVPIVLLGCLLLVVYILILFSPAAPFWERVLGIGNLALVWGLVSFPFFVLMRLCNERHSTITLLGGAVIVFTCLTYGAYLAIDPYDKSTVVGESMATVLTPAVSIALLYIWLLVGYIGRWLWKLKH